MKLTCDPRHNIAYLQLHAKPEQVDTIRVSEELNVDIGPDGTVYGIELLNANAQLAGEDQGKLVALNAEHDTTQEISLTPAPALVREPPPAALREKTAATMTPCPPELENQISPQRPPRFTEPNRA